jgi:glycosyltransferase involved in cell wall biosynthesis
MPSLNRHGPRICFVGLANLPVLAREYGHLGVGGQEVQQTLLARALARRGYDISMVVADYGQPEGATWDNIRTFRAYRPQAGLPVIRFIYPRWTSVWSALKRANADVYYVSGAGMITGLLAMFTRRYGRRMVLRIASNADCDPGKLLIRYARDKKLYQYGLMRADVVLAQSADQQRALRENFGRDSIVAPSVIETMARCLPYEARDIDVLWVGNMRSVKQPKILLNLARAMPQLRFEVAGGPYRGEESLYEECRREAASLRNLKFHGAVPFHDMPALYERARVLVGTSHTEGFPNTYLQAWAHGAPVVAFLDPDALIARNGLGRAVGDLGQMADAVREILADAGRWGEVSARCRSYFERRADENRMLAPYIQALTLPSPPSSTGLGAARNTG